MSDLSERLRGRALAAEHANAAGSPLVERFSLLREAADALDAAEKAIARLASGEAFTTSFYIADSREGDELKARMAFAQAALSPSTKDETK